jgi:nucleoside-diphosphate-sugar epimerase
MRLTILGAGGYIGSHLATALDGRGLEVRTVRRGDDLGDDDLGHVIYCVAVTNDAAGHPFETVRANVGLVAELLRRRRFSSFLYLSSAQLYVGAARSTEDAEVHVDPTSPSELYRASKLMGELLCLGAGDETVRVARLSAVYGERLSPRSFLSGVVRQAVGHGRVVLETTLDSERDFVHVDDVTRVLPEIALRGRHRVYNVASGRNTTNAELVDALARETGCAVEVAADATRSFYPAVDVGRIADEFGFEPGPPVTTRLGALVRAARAGEKGR